MDIPSGLHVQSNKPLDKFLIPTKLDVEAPQGVRSWGNLYPRALLRNLKFSKGDGCGLRRRALIRFNVTVPANYSVEDSAEISKGDYDFRRATTNLVSHQSREK